MSNIEQIKRKISLVKPELSREFGISTIAIFGSYARNEQTSASDVDILVDFNKPIGLKYVDLADQLTRHLGVKAHLVSKRALRPDFAQAISQELIYV